MQHKDIPDGERHEPKGISSALEGQVYVSTGDGSGRWVNLEDPIYGELYGSVLNLTSDAVDTFTEIDNLAKGLEMGVTVDSANAKFIIEEDGAYFLNMNCIHKLTGASDAILTIQYDLNGTPSTRQIGVTTLNDEYRNLSGGSVVYLEKDDEISFEFKISDGSSIQFRGLDITLAKLK